MQLETQNNIKLQPNEAINSSVKPEPVTPVSKHPEKVNFEAPNSIKSLFNTRRLLDDVRYRNNFLSGINAFLHGLATITNFIDQKNPALKLINTIVDKSAFFCTRWLTPYISYGHAAYTAAANQKEPLLSLIKLVPPAFLPLVGDANIDMVYGLCNASNQPYDLITNRIKEKIKDSPEYAKKIQETRNTKLGFISEVFKELKKGLSEFSQGKLDFWKEGLYVINCSFILAGSIPMLLFGRDQRDTTLAKISGVSRFIGGLLGDIGFMFGGEESKDKFAIGVLTTLATFADISKRFVNEDIAKVLIHLGAALNVTGMTLWNTTNTETNKKTIDDEIQDSLEKNAQKADSEPKVDLAKPEELIHQMSKSTTQNHAVAA